MTHFNQKALIIIDIQNDYFSDGRLPLRGAEQILEGIKFLAEVSLKQQIPVILIQHAAEAEAPFLSEGSHGAAIHPQIMAIAPNAPIITKRFADSFEKTALSNRLKDLGINEIILCGMMTQNCVTHTAISRDAQAYKVSVVSDCCTTTDELIHNVAIKAIQNKVNIIAKKEFSGFIGSAN